nr:tmv resistance protein n [Quercus suber]
MCGSYIEQLWKGAKSFEKLQIIQMNGSTNLKETPDLLRVPNLKEMVLEDCLNLRCSKLEKLPEIVGNESVEELDMSGTAIREVPSSIGLLKSLKVLSFSGCKGLSSFNSTSWYDLLPFSSRPKIADPVGLSSLLGLYSLTKLNLRNCNLREIPNDIGCLFSLEVIDLSENSFVCLPDSISQLRKLETMYLNNCTSLRALPNLPVDIVQIWGNGCTSLEMGFSRRCSIYDDEEFSYRYDMVIPGSVIPKWFIHQSIGAEVNIKESSSHLCDGCVGIAVCVVFSCFLYFSVDIRLIANGKVMSSTVNVNHEFVCLSNHIWLCYLLPQYLWKEDTKLLNECEANELSLIGFKIESFDILTKVKKCGFRMVYKKDIEELNRTMAQSSNSSIFPYEDLDHNFDNSAMDLVEKEALKMCHTQNGLKVSQNLCPMVTLTLKSTSNVVRRSVISRNLEYSVCTSLYCKTGRSEQLQDGVDRVVLAMKPNHANGRLLHFFHMDAISCDGRFISTRSRVEELFLRKKVPWEIVVLVEGHKCMEVGQR